ncbi:hypothetical protein FTH_1684 [Francisella tularensis subsp. holarctica OSU18]|nr:hypothetical protein FTH_1684 [Francisella tularensis subsp. holarctica OSU18]ADA77830.1 hypothetical protein NE061598_00820 [Francisella tularensis subsp. tularensis NE061598]
MTSGQFLVPSLSSIERYIDIGANIIIFAFYFV